MENYYQIGEVVRIYGTRIIINALRNKNDKYIAYRGEILDNIKLYSKVMIKSGFDYIIAEIIAEETEYKDGNTIRMITIEIQGFIEDKIYLTGNEKIPMIGNKVYLLNEKLLKILYKEDSCSVELGKLIYLDNMKFSLDFNKLYASHIGIFGNTGSGKSYTLSKLLEKYFEKKEEVKWIYKEKTILFDYSGEYEKIDYMPSENIKKYTFRGKAGDYEKIKIPIDIENLGILLNASERTQRPILIEAIDLFNSTKFDISKIFRELILNRNTALLYSIKKIGIELDTVKKINYVLDFGNHSLTYKKLEPDSSLNIEVLFEFWDKEIKDDLVNEWNDLNSTSYQKLVLSVLFVIAQQSNQEHVIHLLNRLVSLQKDIDKYIDFGEENDLFDLDEEMIIYNVANISSPLRELIPVLETNKLYKKMESDLGGNKFLKIVVDEAHNLLKSNVYNESVYQDYGVKLFEKIIKEGRKYNAFLYLSSQRPSEISETIISQLHNYFVHNLKNYKDINIIKNSISYITENKLNSINSLSRGTVIYGGLASEVSEVIKINEINNPKNIPISDTLKIIKE